MTHSLIPDFMEFKIRTAVPTETLPQEEQCGILGGKNGNI